MTRQKSRRRKHQHQQHREEDHLAPDPHLRRLKVVAAGKDPLPVGANRAPRPDRDDHHPGEDAQRRQDRIALRRQQREDRRAVFRTGRAYDRLRQPGGAAEGPEYRADHHQIGCEDHKSLQRIGKEHAGEAAGPDVDSQQRQDDEQSHRLAFDSEDRGGDQMDADQTRTDPRNHSDQHRGERGVDPGKRSPRTEAKLEKLRPRPHTQLSPAHREKNRRQQQCHAEA